MTKVGTATSALPALGSAIAPQFASTQGRHGPVGSVAGLAVAAALPSGSIWVSIRGSPALIRTRAVVSGAVGRVPSRGRTAAACYTGWLGRLRSALSVPRGGNRHADTTTRAREDRRPQCPPAAAARRRAATPIPRRLCPTGNRRRAFRGPSVRLPAVRATSLAPGFVAGTYLRPPGARALLRSLSATPLIRTLNTTYSVVVSAVGRRARTWPCGSTAPRGVRNRGHPGRPRFRFQVNGRTRPVTPACRRRTR